MSTTSRIAIFVHYDQDSLIENYVITYLSALNEVANEVYFVSNCPQLKETELKKIQPYVKDITLRENIGGDFAAWQSVLLQLSLDSISKKYDELILANDSCYMIAKSFKPMFDSMTKENSDMWGITESIQPFYEDGEKKVHIHPHLQSFFLVFKKKLLQSDLFQDFWKSVNPAFSRDETIIHYETYLTQHFRNHGFICHSYIATDEIDIKNAKKEYGEHCYNLSVFYGYEFLKRGNPLLKVKSLSTTLHFSNSTFYKIKNYLKKNKQKKIFEEILNHLKRTQPWYQELYQMHKLSLLKIIKKLIRFFLRRSKKLIDHLLKKSSQY